MKINDIIVENNEVENYEDYFFVFEQPWFKYNPLDHHLYRRTKQLRYEDNIELFKFKPRQKPVDTLLMFHDYIETLSKEKFNMGLRTQSLFTFGAGQLLSSLNDCVVIPKGDYELFYNPEYDDLTVVANLFQSDFHARMYRVFSVSNISQIIISYVKNYIKNNIKDPLGEFDLESSYETFFHDELKRSLYDYNYDDKEALLNTKSLSELPSFIDNLFEYMFKDSIFIAKTSHNERYKIPFSPALIKRLKNDFIIFFNKLIDEYKTDLNNYVNGMQTSKSVTNDILKSKCEVMLVCDEYWLLKNNFYNALVEKYKSSK